MKPLSIGTAILIALGACAAAGENGGKKEPSAGIGPDLEPDAALLKKIADLPDNTWMKLPPFKVTGELKWLSKRADEHKRGPFGRSYCNHAVWAPDRKRAIFLGGGHNVRNWNDVWEYDLAANTWVCLIGRDPRVKWFCHTWDMFAYDPERKLALFVHSLPRYKAALPSSTTFSEEEHKKKLEKDGIYIWGFDPAKRKWTSIEYMANWKRPGNTIGGRQESGILEYMPDQKTHIFFGWSGPLVRDPKTGTWEKGGKWSKRGGNGRTYGHVGVYDPDTKKVVITGHKKTTLYDPRTFERKVVHETGPVTNDASGHMVYDTAAKKVVLYSTKAKPPFWLYDVEKNEWTDPKPKSGLPSPGRQKVIYYDEARNVTVFYNSSEVWVYRCKKAGK